MQQLPSPSLAALVDTRTADGRKFLAGLPQGVPRFELQGDISRNWYGGLAAWAQTAGPKRLIGFSRDADFFMIGRLCMPVRMHAATLAAHDSRRREVLTHRLAVQGQAGLADELQAAAAEWPATMAAIACAGAVPAPKGQEPRVVETNVPRSTDFPGYLLTWVVETASLASGG